MKRVLLLGATGSIGRNAVRIIRQFPDEFKLTGITADTSRNDILRLVKEFDIGTYGLSSSRTLFINSKECKTNNDINEEIAVKADYDIAVNALVGSIGFAPTYRAIERGKTVALANKETIVAYGKLINRALRKNKNSALYPVDSEHSALWQLLSQFNRDDIKNVYITASGGVMFKNPNKHVKREDILSHPVWNMGPKVTVDSSTMMNKGLEVIEASYLFNIAPERIKVLIHPQSIVHAMIELKDGTFIPHMAYPDMKLPIQYALFYPKRPGKRIIRKLDLTEQNLQFYKAPLSRYRALKLAYRCLNKGSTYTAVYSAANEISVGRFLNGDIGFSDIMKINEKTVNNHIPSRTLSIRSISDAEQWARAYAKNVRIK